MAEVFRKVGEHRPIDAELSNLSRDDLTGLQSATFVIGSAYTGAEMLVLDVEVQDVETSAVRALAPAEGYPDTPGTFDSYWRLQWDADDIEKVPGAGYDTFRLQPRIGT